MVEITANFRKRDLLVPQYVVDKEMKKTRYHDMLRDSIQEFVILSSFKSLEDMAARSQECEIELEHRSMQKPVSVKITVGSAKKPKTFN